MWRHRLKVVSRVVLEVYHCRPLDQATLVLYKRPEKKKTGSG